MGETTCSVCGQPLPTGDAGARRRKYHAECEPEARRRRVALREGRDPDTPRTISATIAAQLASVDVPKTGGRAWELYQDLLQAERTEVSYDEAVAALGGTSKLAQRGLVQLRRLELLIPRGAGRRPMLEVRPPTTPEARVWVAACMAGGKAALPRRSR